MDGDSVLDEECLALESIFEDKFTRLQPDKIRLVISAEGAEDEALGRHLHLQPQVHLTQYLVQCYVDQTSLTNNICRQCTAVSGVAYSL